MIENVLVTKNPWKMTAASGPTTMRRIPNAPSKGIMLDEAKITQTLFKGCDRVRKQLQCAGIS